MTDLSGFWIGRYAYGEAWEKTVRFDAELTDIRGSLSGMVTEPNSFDDQAGELLSALISGSVFGRTVQFQKTYNGDGFANHTVDYSGELNPSESEIKGHWTIGEKQGLFEMRRDGPAIGVKAKKTNASLERVLEALKSRPE